MPSQRRIRVITYLVLAGIVTLLFLSQSRNSNSQSVQGFYSKTVNAMDRHHAAAGEAGQQPIAGHDVDANGDIDKNDDALSKQMTDRLRQAEKKAKENAAAKGPNKPETPQEVIGVGSSASGQKRPPPGGEAKTEYEESEEDHEVEGVLNTILKKSPGEYSISSPIICRDQVQPLTRPSISHHLLQIILPLLQDGQRHSS